MKNSLSRRFADCTVAEAYGKSMSLRREFLFFSLLYYFIILGLHLSRKLNNQLQEGGRMYPLLYYFLTL